ncbi:MAG: 2-hydroxyacid dehydrogenase [Clostridia bacterium]|nr:2-hydroxyacid dehydrogenase [Clostridia bacterium]
MKIAFFDVKDYEIPYFEHYGKEGQVDFCYYKTTLREETARLAEGFDGVCVFVNDRLDRAVLSRLYEGGVSVAALRCAGYNTVDLAAAKGRVRILHVPGYSPHAVAEHTMGMLLTSIRRIHKAYNRTRDFNFSLSGLVGFDLKGKTVGIVGMGRIGSAFAAICKGFGMRVLAYDQQPKTMEGVTYCTLEELFAESDVLSFHCPLNDRTHHMLNADNLSLLKKGVMILNTSRGGLIDSAALLEGIKERRIGGACLDVYEEEEGLFFEDNSGHILEDDVLARLISMPNVLVTSHQAFLTKEALDAIAKTTVSNIISIYEKDSCENELVFEG